jgi:hypothetical protein
MANGLKEELLNGKSARRIFLARPRFNTGLRPNSTVGIAFVTRLVCAVKAPVGLG